tara:strand:- start:428 stop:1099 length:672 start_codon:yes stop_codon:yes gene_type:complete
MKDFFARHRIFPPWLIVMLLVDFAILSLSPPDNAQEMGIRVYMMYVHVPFAWTSFLMTVLGALTASLYLWKKDNEWERISRAIIEVAAVSAFLTLLTGSVWGKITWGTWWVWDARLTTMLILFLILCAYLIVRDMYGTSYQGKKTGSIIAVIAALNVPIVHLSVNYWRTLHQGSTIFRQEGPPKIDSDMFIILLISFGIVLWWAFSSVKLRLAGFKKTSNWKL